MTYKIILGLIFFLPIFFIPGGVLGLGDAKALLMSVGVTLAGLAFLYESWQARQVAFPRSYLLAAAFLLPVIYFLSAILSTPSSLSLLGYNFEVGTFGFILLGALLLALCSVTFSSTSRALSAIIALFASLTLVTLFAVLKIIFPGILSSGNFPGNMGNPLGAWTDLGTAFGLLSLLSVLALGMLPMKRSFKTGLCAVFLFSTTLLLVINFRTALMLTLVASGFFFLYFSKIESNFLFEKKGDKGDKGSRGSKGSWRSWMGMRGKEDWEVRGATILLGLFSLIFLIGPFGLGEKVSRVTGVVNTEVRPTFSSTLEISKSALNRSNLFGSGPNTFSRDWLLYKPVGVNATPFWAVAFPFGVGFIPTQIAATGIVGTLLWLSFLVLVLALALKTLTRVPESRATRFALISVLTAAVYLWAASFLYAPSATLLILAFAVTGLFIGLSAEIGIISSRLFEFKDPATRLMTGVVCAAAFAVMVTLGWSGAERGLAGFHFKRAVDLSAMPAPSLDSIESEVERALGFSKQDTYYLALSRINFAKAQAAGNATSTPESRAAFQESIAKSIQAARSAAAANPASYLNWTALGNLYAALAAPPLAVEGAYESARLAYSEAYKRSPNNPELPLLLAYLEISNGNLKDARSYILSALALKEDYGEAEELLKKLTEFEEQQAETKTQGEEVPEEAQ